MLVDHVHVLKQEVCDHQRPQQLQLHGGQGKGQQDRRGKIRAAELFNRCCQKNICQAFFISYLISTRVALSLRSEQTP